MHHARSRRWGLCLCLWGEHQQRHLPRRLYLVYGTALVPLLKIDHLFKGRSVSGFSVLWLYLFANIYASTTLLDYSISWGVSILDNIITPKLSFFTIVLHFCIHFTIHLLIPRKKSSAVWVKNAIESIDQLVEHRYLNIWSSNSWTWWVHSLFRSFFKLIHIL